MNEKHLGLAQISSFVSHLWALFFCRAETLLHMLQPCYKLTHILLVTGPLRQGTLQLTIDYKSKNKSESIIAVGAVSTRQLVNCVENSPFAVD